MAGGRFVRRWFSTDAHTARTPTEADDASATPKYGRFEPAANDTDVVTPHIPTAVQNGYAAVVSRLCDLVAHIDTPIVP